MPGTLGDDEWPHPPSTVIPTSAAIETNRSMVTAAIYDFARVQPILTACGTALYGIAIAVVRTTDSLADQGTSAPTKYSTPATTQIDTGFPSTQCLGSIRETTVSVGVVPPCVGAA